MTRFAVLALSGFFAIASSTVTLAQDPLDELYGLGVHAYFSGRMDQATEFLTQAIDAGTQDPRAYYFRGLVQARQAGAGAGLADFQQGAELEIAAKRAVNVSKSLERIQGVCRVEIEKARQAARLAAKAQQLMMQRARMEAAGNSAIPGAGLPPSADQRRDPFADDPSMLQGQPREMKPNSDSTPIVPEPMPAEPNTTPADPFDTPATPPADPFADPAPTPATTTGDDDPFK